MFQPSCGNIFLFQQGAEKKDDTERRLRGELCSEFIFCPAEMYIFSVHFHTFKWALILPETMKNSFGCFYHGYRTQRLSAGRLVVPCLNHINPYDKDCSVKRFFLLVRGFPTISNRLKIYNHLNFNWAYRKPYPVVLVSYSVLLKQGISGWCCYVAMED